MPSRLLLFAVLSGTLPMAGERLPVRTYTTADGLPSQTVNCIVRDSRGFLWLCTWDGLVRFDGYTFANYNLDAGIPDRHVTAFLETRGGTYWVGTSNGVAQFEPDLARSGQHPFIRYSVPGPDTTQHVTTLIEDRDGSIWCGTHNGVYRKAPGSDFRAFDLGLAATSWKTRFIQAMALDRHGSLWIGTEGSGLLCRDPDGTVERFHAPMDSISAILTDRQGHVWAGTSNGIQVLARRAADAKHQLSRVYSLDDGLPNRRIKALVQTDDGDIWAGTEDGVAVLLPGAEKFRAFGSRHGFKDVQIHSLGTDPEGNLWIAAESCLMRLSRSGFLTYDTSDGLGGNQVVSIFEDQARHLYVVNGIRRLVINRFDGNHFTAVQPLLMRGMKPISYMGWGSGQTVLQDHLGDWWIPTGEGLCRFSGIKRLEDLAQTRPRAVYTRRDGLPGDDIFHLFEDSHGDLWVGTADTPGLARWQRQAGRFQRMEESEGYRSHNPPAGFAEDRAGNLWVGLFWKGLARYRNSRWQMFTAADGIPDGSLWSLLVDGRGRLWIASSNDGLARVDDPSAEVPRFIRYSTRQGLSSDLLLSVTQDRQGLIYIGTDRGVDMLDPETDRVQHFDASDGLAGGDLAAAFCDRTGALWFGATTGLSRLLPEPQPRPKPPPVRMTGLRIAGVPRPISALGETTLAGLKLNPNENHIEIEFASFNFRPGGSIRYQYRLQGSSPDWSEPADARNVNLAGLAPGSYRFEVRAVSDGLVSSHVAGIAFQVLAPMWRRWWAILTAVLMMASLLYGAHRYRVAQLVEMEKVRTRIALDLHDDIGSSLSQISVLSEVARQQAGRDTPSAQSLARVAEISRDLVDALGDIVWAINPKRDRIGDLVQRMRRFGEDVLNSRNIEFNCHVPEAVLEMELAAGLRRQVFLVFKEGVHNIARHSHCRSAKAELTVEDGQFSLSLSDDGAGFALSDVEGGDGHGLTSMRKRADELGGKLQVQSGDGFGTTILLTAPLRSRYLIRW
jgi:ligand-binding sensor domain-containing protein/signal transduction histidine kinase